MKKAKVHISDLRKMGKDAKEVLSKLDPKKAEELKHTWPFWARDAQLLPEGDWNNWLILAGRGFGKLIRKDTPILTTKGWKTVGDVEIGEYLFDERGKPTKVIKTFDDVPEKAYRLHFSDGTHIDCCNEHQWVTWTHRDRKAYNRSSYEAGPLPEDWPNWRPKKITVRNYLSKGVVDEALELRSKGMSARRIAKVLGVSRVSLSKHFKAGRYIEREAKVDENFVESRVKLTQDIVDTFRYNDRGDLNHSIPLAQPVEFPDQGLKIDPYVFGYWLGDGYKKGGTITCDPLDQPNLKKHLTEAGYDLGEVSCPKTVSVLGLVTKIKEEGAFDKEIPQKYWLASKDQRLAILQGLMDSDGYVDDSHVEFTAIRKAHAEYVMWLARSLGQKPVLSEGRATLNGKDCGPKYRVTWRPAYAVNPFRLPRKAEKVVFGGSQESRNHHRMIVDYEEIEPVPMRCFTVDSPNSLFLVGEGLIPTHNTRCGAETVREWVKQGRRRIALIAPTSSDARDIMIEGESGILNVCWEKDKDHKGRITGIPKYEPSKRRLSWANGAIATAYTAEEPERLRGPQHDAGWLDELAAWDNPDDTWAMYQFGLRLGKHPKTVITTTPKPITLLRKLSKEDTTFVTGGSTYENFDNLAPSFIQTIKDQYEGTRLGRQELYAEILDEAQGALWNRDLLEKCSVDDHPDLVRIVVAVDPAVTAKATSDETGIVVAGIDQVGNCYVLEDISGRYLPQEWAKKAVDAYNRHQADRVVAEGNQGGDLVRYTIQTEAPDIPIRIVHASRGKVARAEPVSALYEQGKVRHLPGMEALEDQMVTWEPLSGDKSPDRLDALVWAITELKLGGKILPNLRLVYSSDKGLKAAS